VFLIWGWGDNRPGTFSALYVLFARKFLASNPDSFFFFFFFLRQEAV
jgi:hypothetical protein